MEVTPSVFGLGGREVPPWRLAYEVEARLLRGIGVLMEVGTVGSTSHVLRDHPVAADLRVGASLNLLHHEPSGLHLQAEVSTRLLDPRAPRGVADLEEPDESALPLSTTLRSAMRRGAWTLRSSVGVEAGLCGKTPCVGARAAHTLILSFDRFGQAAVDVDLDTARRMPLVLAPSFMVNGDVWDVPIRVQLVVPISLSAREHAQAGVMVSFTLDHDID